MSCSSSTVLSRDFLKLEKSNLDAHQFKVGKRKYIDLTSSPEHDSIDKKGKLVHKTSIMTRSDVHNDYKKEELKSADQDMCQRLDLFKKYLFPKALQIIGKSNEEESQAIRRTPSIPLIPPKFGGASRPPSFLERELFPMVKHNMDLPTSSDDKSSAAQLTIFYGGTINVYDNVTIDKAQAIMLLAGENSLSAPVVESVPTIDMTKVTKPVHPSNLPSICKLQADLPIARKYSLQRFLEKRRDRKADNSPYAPSTIPQRNNDEPTTSDDLNDQRSFSPLPFPSWGHFFPIAANKGC